MNDITKAKYYLNHRNSDMQHFTSFGLMLSTAQARYKDVQLSLRTRKDVPNKKEVETLLDYAVLRHLSKFNHLPKNVADAFHPDATLEAKRELAVRWISAG